MIRALLDAFILFVDKNTSQEAGGQRIDLDPSCGFHRARPHALVLSEHLLNWQSTLPLPAEIVTAARNMAQAYGNDSIKDWDDYEGPSDAGQYLLWTDDT